MDKFNVAIADDNEKMLRLLGDIVAKDAELEVVGTAKDGVEAYDPDGASRWSAKRDSLLKSLLTSPYIGAKKKLSLLLQRMMPKVFARIKGR